MTHPDVVYGEAEDGVIAPLLPGDPVMVARYAHELNAFDFMPACALDNLRDTLQVASVVMVTVLVAYGDDVWRLRYWPVADNTPEAYYDIYL